MANSGIEVEVYKDTAPFDKIGIIEARMRPTALREIQGHGAGSFQVPKSNPKILGDPTLLEYRNFVRVRTNGVCTGGFLVTNKVHTIVGEGEQSEEVWTVSGEGLRSWSKDAQVRPPKGIQTNSKEQRHFNFATEQGSWYNPAQWVPAVKNWYVHNWVKGGTNPWKLAPSDWPDAPLAYWIWDRWPTPMPKGYVYFRREFTITAGQEGQHALFFAVDDRAEVYVDGELIHTTADSAWQETTREDFELTAGNHVIAIKAYNYASGPASLVAAFYKIGNAASPTAAKLLFVSDSTWKVCGYPAIEPGWTPGHIVLTLLDEAKARGIRFANNWTTTFSNTHDSAGVPWGDPLAISFDLGATYEEVFEALEETSCDIYLDPETLALSMWKKRGVDRSVENTDPAIEPIILRVGHNLTTADEKGQADIVNTLLLKTADGWEVVQPTDTTSVTKYGVLEGQISTEMSKTQAAALIGEVFEKKSLPEKTATFELIPAPGMVPFENFFEGDYVSAPGEVSGVLEKRRVMSISVTENAVGDPVYAVEFDAIFADRVDDLAKMLSKSTHSSALGAGFSGASGTAQTDTQGSNPQLPASSPPQAPEGVVVSSTGRWADSGTALADYGLTWNGVISNEDDLPVTDIESYEVWGRRSTDAEYGLLTTVFDTFAYLPGYRPGEDWYFQIRAQSRTGGYSFFSNEQHLIGAAPIVPLGAPSTPTLVTELGVVSIKWDGLIAGAAAPSRFKHMEVQRATSLAGTYTAVTSIVASSGVDSTGIVGTQYWYRLVPVDYMGVKGTPSLTATITVAGVDLGSLDEDVADAIEAAQAAADAAAATAGSAAAAAEAAQTAADNAETVAGSAQTAAANAVADAASALSTANTALTSVDGMITWSPNAPTTPDGAGKVADSVWYRTSASGIIGQWRWNGSAWTSSPIDNDAIFSINAVKVTAGTLDAARIAANTITAEKLLIGNFDNLIPDPTFSNVTVSGWGSASHQFMPGGGRSPQQNALRIVSAGAQKGAYNPTNIPVREGEVYRLSVWVKSSTALPASSNLLAPYFQVDRQGTTSNTWGLNNGAAIPADTWTKLETVATTYPLAYRVRAGLYIQATVPAGTTVDFTEPEMIRVSDATLIADGSISTSKIVAGAITADKILAATITGDKIAAGTISTSKLLVGNLDNQVENASFEYGTEGWTLGTGSVIATANPRTGVNVLTVTTTTVPRIAATAFSAFAVEEGEQYRLSAWVRLLSGVVANTGMALRVNWGPTEASTTNSSADVAITADDTTTTYVRQSGVWTAPAGAKYARLVIVTRDSTAGKTYYVDDLSVYQMAAGELIVDGAITAVKIGADEISAVHMQAGSIATAALQAGAITTEKLAADSVTANELAVGSVTADQISAGAIQVSHLSPSVGNSIDISANSSVNIIVGRQDDLESDLDATNGTVEQLSTYYSFGPEGAIIGQSDSAFKLILKNDRVEIVENGIVVSYWDSGRMVVPSFVGNEVVLGNHKLEKYTTGTVVRAI